MRILAFALLVPSATLFGKMPSTLDTTPASLKEEENLSLGTETAGNVWSTTASGCATPSYRCCALRQGRPARILSESSQTSSFSTQISEFCSDLPEDDWCLINGACTMECCPFDKVVSYPCAPHGHKSFKLTCPTEAPTTEAPTEASDSCSTFYVGYSLANGGGWMPKWQDGTTVKTQYMHNIEPHGAREDAADRTKEVCCAHCAADPNCGAWVHSTVSYSGDKGNCHFIRTDSAEVYYDKHARYYGGKINKDSRGGKTGGGPAFEKVLAERAAAYKEGTDSNPKRQEQNKYAHDALATKSPM